METAEKLTKIVVSENNPLYVPNEQQWANMTLSDRQDREDTIIAALEQEFNLMGETTIHFNARASATEVLRRYYANKGQKVFIASDLHTLYPGENAFYPDLLIVFDVETHHRRSWNVHTEKKGLDFVLEIISRGSRRNDKVEKLNLFARLGIPEYFMFDPDNYTLSGYKLQIDDNFNHYQKIISDHDDRVFSDILGLQLMVEDYQLRFINADGLEIPFGDELIDRLNTKLISKNAVIANERKLKELERKEKEQEREEKEFEREQKEQERGQKEQEIELKLQEIKLKEQEKLRADKLEEKVKQLEMLLKESQ